MTIRFLDDHLFKRIQASETAKTIRDWLREVLRVCDFSAGNYVIDVLETMKVRRDSLKTEDLVRWTVLLAKLFPQCSRDQKASVSAGLPLLLATGERTNRRECEQGRRTLALPAVADPQGGWQHVFSAPSDRRHLAVLADEYVTVCSHHEEWKALVDLLRETGATDTPPPWSVQIEVSESNTNSFENGLLRRFEVYCPNYTPEIRNTRPPQWLRQLQERPWPGCAWPAG